MSDETSRNKSSMGQTVGALATIVLTILGLAHVVPEFLVAIATIAFGATLLLHGSAMIAEYARASIRSSATAASAPLAGDGGLSAVLLAGAAGVVLGILALLGISTHDLTAIAVIAFGASLILSASSTLRVDTRAQVTNRHPPRYSEASQRRGTNEVWMQWTKPT